MTALLLVGSATTVGLVAGLFAAFSYGVMPGLRAVDDATFVTTMGSINRAILNPVFGVLFGGAALLAVAAAVAAWYEPSARWWVITGTALHLAAVGVTVGVNVPLNERLDEAQGPQAEARAGFEQRWVRWNLLRSVLGTAALVCLLVGLGRL